MSIKETTQAIEQRRGLMVFIVLAALTAIEFEVSRGLVNPNSLLTIIALVKVGLIVHYFMRLSNVWRAEG